MAAPPQDQQCARHKADEGAAFVDSLKLTGTIGFEFPKLAVRDTDLKLDAVRGDRLPGKGDDERIGLLLADDFELDRGVDRT